jgi:hypothetical protein
MPALIEANIPPQLRFRPELPIRRVSPRHPARSVCQSLQKITLYPVLQNSQNAALAMKIHPEKRLWLAQARSPITLLCCS